MSGGKKACDWGRKRWNDPFNSQDFFNKNVNSATPVIDPTFDVSNKNTWYDMDMGSDWGDKFAMDAEIKGTMRPK